MLKLRPKGDNQQDRQPAHPFEHQVEPLARGRIDPMPILENHQNGPHPRQSFELMQQSLEKHLPLALRAEI